MFYTAPSGYPINLQANSQSPNEVTLQWGPVPENEHNGVITGYEVEYAQSSIDRLTLSGKVTVAELATTVGPLQPFVSCTLCVRAYTSVGAGPFSPIVTTTTDPLGIIRTLIVFRVRASVSLIYSRFDIIHLWWK